MTTKVKPIMFFSFDSLAAMFVFHVLYSSLQQQLKLSSFCLSSPLCLAHNTLILKNTFFWAVLYPPQGLGSWAAAAAISKVKQDSTLTTSMLRSWRSWTTRTRSDFSFREGHTLPYIPAHSWLRSHHVAQRSMCFFGKPPIRSNIAKNQQPSSVKILVRPSKCTTCLFLCLSIQFMSCYEDEGFCCFLWGLLYLVIFSTLMKN